MDKLAALLSAMFPGDRESGWPAFADCGPLGEFSFDKPMLEWLLRTLEPLELESDSLSFEAVLDELKSDNYIEAMRFQMTAIEIYFGSDFFFGAAEWKV